MSARQPRHSFGSLTQNITAQDGRFLKSASSTAPPRRDQKVAGKSPIGSSGGLLFVTVTHSLLATRYARRIAQVKVAKLFQQPAWFDHAIVHSPHGK